MVRVITSPGCLASRQRPGVAGELLVGLVDHDDRVRGGADLIDHLRGGAGAGRIVRGGDDDHGRGVAFHGGEHQVGIHGEVRVAGLGHVGGAGVARVLGIHGIGGGEGQHPATRPAESGQQLPHDLVGSVSHPDVAGGQAVAEVGGQVLAERHRLPVRVAVHRRGGLLDGLPHGPPQLTGWRIGVLVDVEDHGHVDLRCAIGFLPHQIVPERQAGEPAHRLVLTVMAAACPGRSSASANRSIPSAISLRACAE